jgi:uncharacterized OsmC-like protein
MEVTVEHLGASQFEIKARTHILISDQPLGNAGHDEGMTPPELCLASLGACAGYYAAEYLHHHKLATEGTRIQVSAGKAKNPARLDDFHITVEVPVEVDEHHRAGLERAVGKCLIHNTLTHPPSISLEIRTAH